MSESYEYKKIILTLLIFSILLSISSVSAVESNFTDLYSDTNPITTLDSLNAEIDNSNENGIIYLNETELHAKNTIEPITIDKSISIIGENTIINGDEKGNLFVIKNSEVTIKNIKFTNTFSYIITNEGI